MTYGPRPAADHLIVVSLDGLSASDRPDLEKLPHFSQLMSSGATVSEIEGVYPTQTYTLHASLATGCYPHQHGVISNTRFEPGKMEPDWHWYAADNKCLTLFQSAKQCLNSCVSYSSFGGQLVADLLNGCFVELPD